MHVPSPQRYDLGGSSLHAVMPPEKADYAMRPSTYYRRILEAGTIEAHAVALPPGTEKPFSVREEALIVLMTEGSMETRLEGHPDFECQRLTVTYHPPGQWGSGTVGQHGVNMLVLSMSAAKAHALDAPANWRPLASPLPALRALAEFVIGDVDARLAIEELTTAIVADAALRPTKRRPSWWRRMEECLAMGDLSLSELAREVGVHPVHLASTYRAIEGKTLGESRRQRKIEVACRLIIETSWSIGEIAHELGYADQAHFTRAFRSTVGCTPTRMRGINDAFFHTGAFPRKP